jgi:hypothetical protein
MAYAELTENLDALAPLPIPVYSRFEPDCIPNAIALPQGEEESARKPGLGAHRRKGQTALSSQAAPV